MWTELVDNNNILNTIFPNLYVISWRIDNNFLKMQNVGIFLN